MFDGTIKNHSYHPIKGCCDLVAIGTGTVKAVKKEAVLYTVSTLWKGAVGRMNMKRLGYAESLARDSVNVITPIGTVVMNLPRPAGLRQC
jgi:hypothetical protein